MKKTILALSVLLLGTAQAEEFPVVRDAVKSLAADIKIDSIRLAPFEGFAEVLLGAQLIYVSLDGKYLIDGQLIDIQTRRNLSESAKGVVRSKRLADVGSEQRFVFPAVGETKHSLTVFTDIDCGYCRRLHQEMQQYNELGIEITYLMFPRAGIGSESYDKAVSVWCADDRNNALTLAKAGDQPEARQCPNPVEMHFELGRELGVSGTPALVSSDGSLIPGYVPAVELLRRLEETVGSAQ